eukprot:g25445.t1
MSFGAAQALPPDVNRLALFPTLQEQQDFGFDLAKLETQVPDGPWPAAKLMKKLVSIAPEAQGAHTWALLILSDAMVPAMKYHLDLLAKARARLEKRGYCVIGMWLSPWSESKLKNGELSREFRARAAKLLVSTDELTMVSTWELHHEGKPSAAEAGEGRLAAPAFERRRSFGQIFPLQPMCRGVRAGGEFRALAGTGAATTLGSLDAPG